MTVADHLLPVWTLRPNWSEPVSERLEWLTDVRASATGVEQSEAIRLSPRRSLEALFTPTDQERSFLSLSLHQLGTQEWMVPLWHDAGSLDNMATLAATTLSVDTTYREFVDDGMALLVGPDAFSCEAVRIDTVSDSAITLVDGTTRAWPAGTVIHPLRRAELEGGAAVAGLTSRVGKGQIRFLLSGDNDIDAGEEILPTFEGLPLLLNSPNWSRSIDVTDIWMAARADYELGRSVTIDTADRGFLTQQHNWLISGRQAQWEFRQLLYRLRGRQRPLWLPTFMHDIIVSRDSDAGDTAIDIHMIGASLTGIPAPGRDHILIGDVPIALASLGASPSASEERLNLVTPLPADLPAGTVIRFVDVARLDQDAIEITHHGSTDGAASISAAFRTFDHARDGTAVGDLPLPTAEMSNIPCSDDPDAEHDWVWEFFYEVTRGTYGYYDGANYPNPALLLYPVDDDNVPGGILDVPGADCFPIVLTSEGNEETTFCLSYVDLAHLGETLTPDNHLVSDCLLGPDEPIGFEPETGEPTKFARGRIRFWFAKPEERRWAMDIQFPAGSGANERSAKIRYYWRMRTDVGENFIREDTVVSLFPTTHVFTM